MVNVRDKIVFAENSMLKGRNSLLVLAISCILGIGIFGISMFNSTAEKIVIDQSERTSLAWANHIGNELQGIESIAGGADISPKELKFLNGVRDLGDIFRFKLFDVHGRIRLISDDLRKNLAEHPDRAEDNWKALSVVKTGKPYSDLADGTGKPDRPEIYSETYVPVIRDGRIVAIAEVYMDRTANIRATKDKFWRFGWQIVGMTLLMLLIPGAAVFYMTNRIRQQDASLHLEQSRAQRSEALFHAIVDNSPTKIHIKDLDGHYILINKVAGKLYGGSVNDIQGKSTGDLFSKEQAQAFMAHDQAVLDSGEPSEYEETFESDEGVRTFLTVKFPLRDGDELIGIGAVGTDITERKAAEQERRRAAERISDFADISADWLWETDEDLRFTYVSPRVVDIMGVPPEYFLGRSLLNNPTFQPLEELEEQYKADINGRRSVRNSEFRFVRPDNVSVVLEVNGKPTFGTNGAFTGYRGSTVDVTESKRAERALRISEQRLRGAIESMQEGFVLFDKKDRIVAINDVYRGINPQAQQLLDEGMTFEDLIRANVDRSWMVEARGQTEEFIRKRIEQHRNPGQAIVRQFGDGKFYMLKETRTPEGGIALTFVDISELKRAERELKEALAEAQRANNAKSEFLAAMSHELRTPLNAIIGYSELISGQIFGPIGSDKYLEYVKDIEDSGKNLFNLVDEILNLTKIEAGRGLFSKEDIAVSDIVEECSAAFADKIVESGIDYSVSLPNDLAPVNADRNALDQILQNLLSNAIKFTSEEGQVKLSVSATNAHHIFTISDTGKGVEADKLATLTEPFVKSQTDPHIAQEGLGIGLTIVKSLADLHDGVLLIDSELGVGTTIAVMFPRPLSSDTEAVSTG
jgi:two-component system, cell cycle sensor histidine kinase PleC